jgi:heat shock protein HslJ
MTQHTAVHQPSRVVARRTGPVRALGALVVVGALVLAGCGDDGDDVSSGDSSTSTTAAAGSSDTTAGPAGAVPTADELEGRTFLSTSVEGRELVDGSVLRLSFDGDQLAAHAGCNTMTGGFGIDAGTLAWSDTPAATMMACEDDLMAQDTWVAEVLTAGLAAQLGDGTLTLSGDGVVVQLEEETDASLTGTTWTLDTLVSNEAASGLPAEVDPPTLEIADDGTVTLFSGCNTGGGAATIGEDTLELEPLRLTMMACEGEAGRVEAAVLAVLDGTVEFAIDGPVLSLSKDGNGLRFRAP